MQTILLMTRTRRRTILIVLFSVVGLLCYARLYFGVDLTDESFYAAVPYEYVLGDHPFVDELNAHPGQSFAFLTYPLVRAYYAVASWDGLVLALRHAYFALVTGVALLFLLLLRRLVEWPWLLAGGLGYMALVPYSVPALSYNTMAAGFLACGFMFGLNYLLVSHARPHICLAGVFHGLAAIAYPPLLLVLPAYAIALWSLRPSTRARTVLTYCLGALVFPTVCGAVILMIGPSNVVHALSFSQVTGVMGGGSVKLKELLFWHPAHWAARVAPAALLAVVAIVAGRKRTRLRRWCIALIPVAGLCVLATGQARLWAGVPFVRSVPFYWSGPWCYWSVLYIILLGLYSWLVVLYELGPSDSRRCLVVWGLVPALFAGGVTAHWSANGFVSAWVGLAPSVLVAAIATGLAARSSRASGEQNHAAWIRLTPVAAVLVAGLLFQWVAAYNEAPIWELTTRVQTGPFRGLYTTPERSALVQGMAADIDAVAAPADTIFFLPDLPYGYLLSAVRPAGPSVWLGDAETNPAVGTWYEEASRTPKLVVDFRRPASAPAQHHLNLWGSSYEAVIVRDSYVIYRLDS